MKKLSSLAAACAGLLFVSVCVGLVTASPLGAQGNRPPTDVNVINTPNVKIVSLPAVQVGNSNSNPVPVQVTNPPSQQDAPEPITINEGFQIDPANLGRQVSIYTVSAGKRLVIEFLSVDFSETISRDHRVGILTSDAGHFVSFYFDVNGTFFSDSASSHRYSDTLVRQVQIFAGPGSTISLLGLRSTSGTSGFVQYALTGHLESVP